MIFNHKIRVRYAECDRMGFVHHSNYALYFEEARTEYLRDKKVTYKELEDEGIIMPVRSMGFSFYYAAKYDDLLTIQVTVPDNPTVRLKFTYKVYNQLDELLSEGFTELFFVNKTTMKPIRVSKELLARMV
jgi:acyl-CoA thioester hydrolase